MRKSTQSANEPHIRPGKGRGSKQSTVALPPGLPDLFGQNYSYTREVSFRDPKTGRQIPVSVGVVASDGFLMTWLKAWQ